MDALDRVVRIERGSITDPWPAERFRPAAAEGKRRWVEVEEVFGIQYPMFQDAIAAIAPAFEMP
jgi:hypothetical protein